ncbi:MAG TPA: HAD-IA family hydrolase [Burkholderiales bacterium]|nr:HAD-IA family hydrolase [Burkholderiales bacterium]
MTDAGGRGATRAVLFDLDGTLADTATDLGAAVNRLRARRGLADLATRDVRAYASSGARGLLRVGLGLNPGDPDYETMRDAFLAYYAERVCVDTRLFPGISQLLAEIGARGLKWGIVTNKATRFTAPIVAALGVAPDCVVCGDTTPHSKPHPAPLLHAAKQLALEPRACCYVGDDLRDVQAAHAAGMRAIAVLYGYHGVDNGGPATWNADAIIAQPTDLIAQL